MYHRLRAPALQPAAATLEFATGETAMRFVDQLITVIKYIALIGILAHVLGEALPRKWFHWDRFPYRAFPWEAGGRIYETMGIRRWKDRLPDKSKHTKKTFTKQIKGHDNPDGLIRFLQETCVAEFVHWCLLLLSFPLYSYVPTPFGAAVTVLYALSNVPFICIQRYNRPRLLRLLNRRLNPQ